jgi:hypothetical protein
MKKILFVVLSSATLILSGSSCSTTPPAGCADNITIPSLSTGLLAYYKFPSSGAQLNDYGGNGYHLSNVGSATPDVNRVGSPNCAMRFNGTNYLQAPPGFPAVGVFATTPFTVMVTYQPDATSITPTNLHPILIGQFCGSLTPAVLTSTWGSANFLLGLDSAKVPFSVLNPNAAYSGSPIAFGDNSWHNAAVTWDGINTMKVYQFTIPGTLFSQSNIYGPITNTCTSTYTTIIGYGFKGIIDDIKIWNRVLTASELNTSFNYDSPCCP